MKPSIAELAAGLGLSERQVHRDRARGMPGDSLEAARAWRDRYVRPLSPHDPPRVDEQRLVAELLTAAANDFANGGAFGPAALFCRDDLGLPEKQVGQIFGLICIGQLVVAQRATGVETALDLQGDVLSWLQHPYTPFPGASWPKPRKRGNRA